MNFPIIDISKQSVAQFSTGCSRARALRFVAWYRVGRPVLVLCTWMLAVAYIRWCLANASDEELSLKAFVPCITGIATVTGSMILWTLGRRTDAMSKGRVHRMQISAALVQHVRHDIPAGDVGRCLVAYHDDDGMISHVVPMPEFERQTA
ncbi:hypothetical protein [Paraburkholderia sp. RL17-337-BIB-A]|uniref:hypothetical protein n=1 Tax=Paraburkholderia sp. RL17-337-BIB-A TaxID=3031636 RepID=UPI0038BD697B